VLKNGKPRPGFESKVFYVWFDAPIEYIAATVEWSEATRGNWERWWRTDKGADDAIYVEFMGKDNVAFHTVSFPVTIMGSGEPWKLVDRLKAFNWVTWYGGKFSTSEQRGIFMDQALELLPSDYWRWYLMANAPETADAPFTLEHFQQTVNADLANVLGNFVNRITRFAESRFDSSVPDGGEAGALEQKLVTDLGARLAALTAHHEAMEFRKAAAETRALWVLGNEYLQAAAPWTAIRTDRDRAAVGVRVGLNLCALFAILAQPFIPDAAAKILDAIGVPEKNRMWPSTDDRGLLDALPRGLKFKPPDVLFRKVEDAQTADWAARFGAG
jgi:methionyl-tRNA synthetase